MRKNSGTDRILMIAVSCALLLLAGATAAVAETKAELMVRARAAADAARVAADEASAAAAEARARADAAAGIMPADVLPAETAVGLKPQTVTSPAEEEAGLQAGDLLEDLPPAPVAATK